MQWLSVNGYMVGMAIWLAFIPSKALAFETISEFESQITINRDTSLTIEETITYETDESHHGIYRYIPIKYRVENTIVEAPVRVEAVTDEAGANYPYTLGKENDSLYVKIGDPETTFSGTKIFKIGYRVTDAVVRLEAVDELYWDITGEGWQIPIEKVRAAIVSPEAVITKAVCYAGPVGADDGFCQAENGDEGALISYDVGIEFGENVTAAVALARPNGLIFPSETQKLVKQIKANWFVPFLLVPLLLMFGYWYRNGRDFIFISPNVFDLDPNKPQKRKPLLNGNRVPFVYEPLPDLTPGEAGAIVDEKVDHQDVIADVMDLARKGYLKIERIEKQGWFGKTDYEFTRLEKDTQELPGHQQTLLIGLVKQSGNAKKMSGLKGSFYKTMVQVKQEIDQSLTARKLYAQNPNTSRGIGLAIAIGLNVVVFLLTSKALAFVGSFWWYVVFGIQAMIGVFLGLQITQKTAIGSNLAMQARGLQRTIQTGKWREEIKEKNLFIEDILPFAVALGVVDKLARDMQELGLKPPEYFHSPTMTAMAFNSLVSDFSAQATNNLAYNPASRSASGGSGFSGGSSGGGGGGGGGGSW